MTEAQEPPSVIERTRPVAVGAAVIGAHFIGKVAVFALGEEAMLLARDDAEEARVVVHAGGILATAGDGARVVTGGDDGKVMAVDGRGQTSLVARDPKGRWIDHVALGPDGMIAWSAGKSAFALTGKGDARTIEVPSTVGGLAFAPKGKRLAVAHYNGVSLWFPNAAAAPERLEWKGSHLTVSFSPDGKFLVTAMQEPMLHGWRVVDRKHMRMSGYSAKVRSLDWTADGKWLASSGSEQLILWPFQSKDGPMGQSPRMLAPYPGRAAIVACHPREAVAAVGYADGLLLLVRIEDGAEILARKPTGAPVSALAWRADGKALAFGTEAGEAGIIDLG
ncbi:MAG TPA: WD40 repeat domain-containing protein [Xanthobacteraceae bacterium]|nr:WD40 repeat domain-containing protein [Xanthobacteraceae bacterium]